MIDWEKVFAFSITVAIFTAIGLAVWGGSSTKEELQLCLNKCESISAPMDYMYSDSFLKGSIRCTCGQTFIIPAE